MKITETHHDAGRSFRTTRERFISMKQALDIHDPFQQHADSYAGWRYPNRLTDFNF